MVANLNSLHPDLWGGEWGKLGAQYEALADEQNKTGKQTQAGETLHLAYEYYRIPPLSGSEQPAKDGLF